MGPEMTHTQRLDLHDKRIAELERRVLPMTLDELDAEVHAKRPAPKPIERLLTARQVLEALRLGCAGRGRECVGCALDGADQCTMTEVSPMSWSADHVDKVAAFVEAHFAAKEATP